MWRFYTHRLTRAGRWFLSVTAFMLFAVSPTLDIQAYVPLSYAVGLWTITGLAVLFNRPRVKLKSSHAPRISSGEVLPVKVEMTQQSRLWGVELNVLPARLPLEIDSEAESGVPVGGLAPGETRTVRVGLLCKKRGQYTLRGFRVESDFPFGLLNAYREYKTDSALLVVPSFLPIARMDLPVGTRTHPGGMALTAHLGDSFEFLGNREFREGDNLRDIDWRATARLGGLPIVREYREEYFLRVGVVLDTWALGATGGAVGKGRAARRVASAEGDAAFEAAVSACASVADYLAERDYLIDLFAAGPSLYYLTTGHSVAVRDQVLDILACVPASPTDTLATIEPEIHANLAQITSIVCVFLTWDDARRSFVERLRANGTGVKVILVSSDMTGLTALPASTDDLSFIVLNPSDASQETGGFIW